MDERPVYSVPVPIIDTKEENSIDTLNARYEKLCKPTVLGRAGKAVSKVVPDAVKSFAKDLGNTISDQELYAQVMKVIVSSFKLIEETAAKYTIPRSTIIKRVNKTVKDNTIIRAEEICLARAYNISKLVSNYRTGDLAIALAEGAGTGFFGFAGLPFNLVLCMFICYRAVQSVAMFYGYDVKEDPSELIIASDVFMNALSPSTSNANEVSSTIVKIMTFAEAQSLKQATKKTYAEMISKGGTSLLVVQLRALANKAAKKALDEAGVKGLESSAFKAVFEQIGKGLGKKSVGKMIPGVSAVIGAAFDISQMNTVISYADVFYNKRFLLEKKQRINALLYPMDAIIIEDDPDKHDKDG